MECGGNACCQIPLTKNGRGWTTNQSKWDMSADGEYDYMCVPSCWIVGCLLDPSCRWSRSAIAWSLLPALSMLEHR